MALQLVRKVLASLLLLVLTAGGGGMPAVDALLFHRSAQDAGTFRPHFEATSACHADGCSARSLASQNRLAPELGSGELRVIEPTASVLLNVAPSSPRTTLPTSQLSRAPPVSN